MKLIKESLILKKGIYTRVIFLLDYLVATLVWIAFFYIRKDVLGEEKSAISTYNILSSMLVGGMWSVIYFLSGFYQEIFRKSRIKEFLNLILITLIGSVILFFVALLDDEGVRQAGEGIQYQFYYKTAGTFFVLHFSFAVSIKMIQITYLKKLIKKKKIWFNTIVVGSNQNALEIFKDLKKVNYSLGLKFIGYVFVKEKTKNLLSSELRNFGSFENLPKLIRRANVQEVIIAVEPSEYQKISKIMDILAGTTVKISIIPDLYQIMTGSVKVNHILGVPLIEVKQVLMPLWQQAVKRMIDIFSALFVIICLFPFWLTLVIMTKLSSKGPIFYRQERIGKGGLPFKIIKFRSMYVGAEKHGPALSSDNDPRITPWGKIMRKTRMDEIPQFINVLKGDMSLVGPRPERSYFIEKIVEEAPHYKYLLQVRPGITSLGQVKYGYAENVSEMVRRLKYDIIYLENMSLAMDIRILMATIIIIFQGRGK